MRPTKTILELVTFSVETVACKSPTWSVPGSYHPDLLGTADIEAIMASNQLFARKFDASVDREVLDLIDARVDAAAPRSSAEPE